MRRLICFTLVVVAALCVMRLGMADGQEKKAIPPDTLDKLIADGLRNSGDIKVAEAKVRLAEAELERARTLAKVQIAAAVAEIFGARDVEQEAKSRRDRADELRDQRAISAEEHGISVLTWLKAKNERLAAEL